MFYQCCTRWCGSSLILMYDHCYSVTVNCTYSWKTNLLQQVICPKRARHLYCNITIKDEDWQSSWLLLKCASGIFHVLSSVAVLFLRLILCIWVHCVPCKTFTCWFVRRWQQNMPPRSPSHHSKKQPPIFSPSKIIWIYVHLKAFSIAHYSNNSGLRCAQISIHLQQLRVH